MRALVLAALFFAAQETAPPATPVEPEARPQAVEASVDDVLQVLAAVHPELASLTVLGVSGAGREIRALRLFSGSAEDVSSTPGVLVCSHAGPQDEPAAEAVLALGRLLVERAGSDPRVRNFLERHVVWVVPELDPDGSGGPSGAAPFDLDFPLGWAPGSVRTGAAAYPLSRPETLAAARFLSDNPNLVLAIGVSGRERGEPWSAAEASTEDRETLLDFASAGEGEPRPLSWYELGSAGGGFLDFAYQAFGVYPVVWSSDAAASGTPEWVDAVAEGSWALLAGLPQLALEADGVERLGSDLWRVDLTVRNAGLLATLSELGARRGLAGALEVRLEGGRLAASAQRKGTDEPFRAARLHAGSQAVRVGDGRLAGGTACGLRLVVEAEAGAELTLRGTSLRAGEAFLTLRLPAQEPGGSD